jgi:hypothetical protein
MNESLILNMSASLQPLMDVAETSCKTQENRVPLSAEIPAPMTALKAETDMLRAMLDERKSIHNRLFFIEKELKSAGMKSMGLYPDIGSQRAEIADYRCRYEFLQEDGC